MSDEWNTYHYVKESGSAVQPKEKNVETVEAASEEGTLIKSTVEKGTKISNDDTKTIKDERDIQMDVSNVATEKG